MDTNKQKIHFITFGDIKYKNSLKRIEQEANNLGIFESVTIYTPEKISEEFYKKYNMIYNYASLYDKNKGAGYWIWKFYIIPKRLSEINDNDILIYLDAGCSINKNTESLKRLNDYVNILNNSDKGIISFELPDACVEKRWTVLELLKLEDIDIDSEHYNTNQLVGGILIMKKCPHINLIFDKCIELIDKDPFIITNKYVKKNQELNAFFKDNRNDQSILSIIRKKYGSAAVLRDETYIQINDYPNWNNEWIKKMPFWATRIK